MEGPIYKTVEEAITSLIEMYHSFKWGYSFYSSLFYWSDYVFDYMEHLDRFPNDPNFYVDYMRKFRAMSNDLSAYPLFYNHGECECFADLKFLLKLVDACYICVIDDENYNYLSFIQYEKLFKESFQTLRNEDLLCDQDFTEVFDYFENCKKLFIQENSGMRP